MLFRSALFHLDAALETLKSAKLALQSCPEGKLVSCIVQSQVHTRNGNSDEANRSLDEAARLRADGARVDGAMLLDLASSSLAQGRDEEADAIIGEAARNAHDSAALLTKASKLYAEAGREEAGARVLAEATTEVRKLNNDGVMLAHKGDFTSAVERLMRACELAPYNPRILMNGVWIVLKCLERDGMDEEKLYKARELLAEVERQSPGHSRLVGLRTQLSDIESRFGIRGRSFR